MDNYNIAGFLTTQKVNCKPLNHWRSVHCMYFLSSPLTSRKKTKFIPNHVVMVKKSRMANTIIHRCTLSLHPHLLNTITHSTLPGQPTAH